MQVCLFGLHHMKARPNLLALVGFVMLLISSSFKLKWMSAGAAVGYMTGFVVGAVFNTNGVDAGGSRTNNFWIIWTAAYFFVVVAGLVMDKISRSRSAEK